MYSPSQGANTVIRYSFQQEKPISPLKLQKLLYFLHGWFLAVYDQPLFSEEPEAWQFGPVFPDVYHDYKIFGSIPISKDNFEEYGTLSKGYIGEDDKFEGMLDEVWGLYAPYSALHLSDLTHRSGTPWSLARDRNDRYLAQDEIRDHFKSLMKK